MQNAILLEKTVLVHVGSLNHPRTGKAQALKQSAAYPKKLGKFVVKKHLSFLETRWQSDIMVSRG